MTSRRPTVIDVARHAGVATGTVSRVLNVAANVDPAIRARVEAAMDALGYRPNALAQGMRRGASRMVGIIVRDIAVPSLATFVSAADQVLAPAGYALLLANSEDRKEREIDLLDRLATRRIDGLIMTTAGESDADLLAARVAFPAPVVLLDRESPADEDAVLVRHGPAISEAVDALARGGHRRIALLTGNPDVYPARARIDGYRAALEGHGLAFEPALLRADSFGAADSLLGAATLLSAASPPTALIVGGASLLPGVLRALRAATRPFSEAVSLIAGFDSDLCQLLNPAVAAIAWDYGELGRLAARLLLDRMSGTEKGPARRVGVPATFTWRPSCGPAPS